MNDYMKQRMGKILAGRPLPEKKKYTIPKVSEKRKAKLDENKKRGSDTELDLFFQAMKKKCKGKCLFCNQPTTYKHETFWRIAIAHLLPKSKFKSISANENNWIELCWSCHTNFDNGQITWLLLKDSKEWEIIKEKLLNVLPMVSENEKKNKLYDRLVKLCY